MAVGTEALLRAAELPGTNNELLAKHGWTWRLGVWVYRDRLSRHVRRLDPWPDGRPAGWAPSYNDNGNCATAYEAMGRIAPWEVAGDCG